MRDHHHVPFLIIEAGAPVEPLRRHGSFGHWIRHAAGLPRDRAVVCRPHAGEALPQPDGFAGVLVSGSAAMVSDRAGWSEDSAAFLRAAAAAGLPVLGICYGHQLLAHAFGGEVGNNPAGREMGTVEVRLEEAARHDPLLGGLPERFLAHATHQQTVLAPPPGAVRLARSDQDDWQALRIGERSWGVQFHPEFSRRVMRGYIDARADALRAERRDPPALRQAVRATPWARSLLRRFVRLGTAAQRSGDAIS